MVWDKKWGFKERLKLKVLFFRKGIDIVIYFRLVFCDCGFQPVYLLMEKDKRLMEVS